MHQTQLPGAFFGPSIPPPQNHRRHHHRSGCRTCLCVLCWILITLIVLSGIFVLVVWLVLRPLPIKAYVDSATLTQFNLTSPTYISFNLNTTISIRNPNRKLELEYDQLRASVYYYGEWLGQSPLPSFAQGTKNTTVLYPVFTGNNFIGLGDFGRGYYDGQSRAGKFNVDVRVDGKVRYRVGSQLTRRYNLRIKCYLEVPLQNNDKTASGLGFSRTRCAVY